LPEPTDMTPGPGRTDDAPRDCGGCNVCCTAMHVKPLEKPAGTPCAHQADAGCGIYRQRPTVCRNWFCLWVRDGRGLFSDEHRPDRLGVFFTASDPEPDTGRQTIYAHEVRAEAASEPAARAVIQHLRQAVPVSVLPYRPPRSALTPLTLGRTAEQRRDVDADADAA